MKQKMAKIGVAFLAFCALVSSTYAVEGLYSDKYDYVNVDEIIGNNRIRNQYFNCFLEIGPCLTPDAKFFKEIFPESLVTKCRRCTEKQKESFEKLVLHYTEKEPEKWRQALTKAIADLRKKRN